MSSLFPNLFTCHKSKSWEVGNTSIKRKPMQTLIHSNILAFEGTKPGFFNFVAFLLFPAFCRLFLAFFRLLQVEKVRHKSTDDSRSRNLPWIAATEVLYYSDSKQCLLDGQLIKGNYSKVPERGSDNIELAPSGNGSFRTLHFTESTLFTLKYR